MIQHVRPRCSPARSAGDRGISPGGYAPWTPGDPQARRPAARCRLLPPGCPPWATPGLQPSAPSDTRGQHQPAARRIREHHEARCRRPGLRNSTRHAPASSRRQGRGATVAACIGRDRCAASLPISLTGAVRQDQRPRPACRREAANLPLEDSPRQSRLSTGGGRGAAQRLPTGLDPRVFATRVARPVLYAGWPVCSGSATCTEAAGTNGKAIAALRHRAGAGLGLSWGCRRSSSRRRATSAPARTAALAGHHHRRPGDGTGLPPSPASAAAGRPPSG